MYWQESSESFSTLTITVSLADAEHAVDLVASGDFKFFGAELLAIFSDVGSDSLILPPSFLAIGIGIGIGMGIGIGIK